MKKSIIYFAITILLVLIISLVARIATQRLASEAVRLRDYRKLEKICSLPIKNLDGVVISDFLRTIIEEKVLDTPLELACESQDLEAAKILLKHGANPNYEHQFEVNGHKPLEIAISSGDLEMVKLLIEAGADAQESGLQGVDILIRYGTRKKIPLDSFKSIYSFLNESGACLNTVDLIDAVGLGADIEVLQWLITEKGMSINSCNKKGQTFLHLCCLSGIVKTEVKEPFVLYCLANNAGLDIKDSYGKTAYDYASEKETEAFAEIVSP